MRRFIVAILCVCAAIVAGAATVIDQVRIAPATFDPSANDSVTLSVSFRAEGRTSIVVVDRDGYLVRRLASDVPVHGPFSIVWNGRDDSGAVVADEAYSFRIDWTGGTKHETWFPAATSHPMISITARYYDRRGGTLAYTLPAASRVHLQAGTTPPHSKRGSMEGAVMKTIVNRAPRVAGAIAEPWNGFDESGTVYLPDLPDFVVAIAATPLPEEAVIAFGNRQKTFLEAAAGRQGKSLLPANPAQTHLHHAGLEVFDDVSPDMRLEVVNGRWSAQEHLWVVNETSLRLRAVIAGPTAERFRRQPAVLWSYVNSALFGKSPPNDPAIVTIPASRLRNRVNLVTLNWSTSYGGLAANTVRVRIEPATAAAGGGGGR